MQAEYRLMEEISARMSGFLYLQCMTLEIPETGEVIREPTILAISMKVGFTTLYADMA